MPVVLPNIKITTQRPSFNATTGGTSAPSNYLVGLVAHIEPIYARHLYDLPSSASKASYMLTVKPTDDVQVGDTIVNITLLDGVTPWPNDMGSQTTWMVNFERPLSPGPLASKVIYIQRLIYGGTAHP